MVFSIFSEISQYLYRHWPLRGGVCQSHPRKIYGSVAICCLLSVGGGIQVKLEVFLVIHDNDLKRFKPKRNITLPSVQISKNNEKCGYMYKGCVAL